ncbi:MAG: DUF2169 domain-containing protein, partial [Comamonadaceae bacterium]
MQVYKPMSLGLSTRPIEYRKRYGLCVTASLHVPFAQGGQGNLWGEQSMWDFLGKEMAVPLIDEGVTKLTAEFLVHGQAFSQPDRPNGSAVRARVGPVEKTLLVFGDRHWDGAQPSAPAPFTSMPIDWSRAYGGADFALNPAGKGRTPRDGVAWLPNIESPAARLSRPDQAVTPAGFGALDLMHPQRAQYRGTYDESYLREHSPGFAPDLDWRFFNLAPADQWLPAGLRGDEPFAFDHMHPSQPQISGRLPGLRARVFVNYAMPDGSTRLKEVPMRLTTAWFFPHAERSILLFHGLAEVRTDDGSDVACLMGAVERLDQTRDDAHYAHVLDKRADPVMGGVHGLEDADLLPDGLDDTDPAAEQARAAFATDGLQAEAQRVRAECEVALAREDAVAAGHDPDALGIRMPPREKPPQLNQLAAYLKKKSVEIEQQRWAMLEDAVTQVEKALELMAQHELPPSALVHRGPPLFSAEARLDEMAAALATQGKVLQPAAVYPSLIKQEALERAGYLQSAHAQVPAPAMPEAQARALRAEIGQAAARGLREFRDMDLTGADLSGLDLRDCRFGGAWLESANLARANLSGADFSGAVLAHADLAQSVAIGARFAGANLGRSRMTGAVFDDA